MQDFSSTKARAALAAGEVQVAERMLGAGAVAYIRAERLYGAAPGASSASPDFSASAEVSASPEVSASAEVSAPPEVSVSPEASVDADS